MAIVDENFARKYWPNEDPIGKQIQVDGNGFTIVGVMEKQGETFGNDRDDLIARVRASMTE